MRKAGRWRIGRAREGALHMADDDHFQQIGENFRRVFNLLDVLAFQVADVKATGERIESKLDTHIIDTRTEFVRVGTEFERVGTEFACVDRRLGNIENRVESLETHVAHIDSTLLKLL